jgi:hypothetical protein
MVAVPVARLGCGFDFFVDSAKCKVLDQRGVWSGRTYRTVRASSSIGAPDRTAAGRTSVSSLPFITRLGTGEKVLFATPISVRAIILRSPMLLRGYGLDIRGSLVHLCRIIRLVMLRNILLSLSLHWKGLCAFNGGRRCELSTSCSMSVVSFGAWNGSER